tara:strand:+ start:1588 stop:2922 length:1335 start_codon:yes stop_codon:yes gene_type:complete
MNNLKLIKDAKIVNSGEVFKSDILIENDRIKKISPKIDLKISNIINANNKFVIPGVIDDQVHFREPGLTHKASIYSESKAAVAGGITSFMEMPNTIPQTLNQKFLDQKFEIASKTSLANYSFYMGASNDNYDEILKINPKSVPGLKIFMGSSTGNMLVDNLNVLEKIFANSNMLIAVHCEDERIVKSNLKKFKQQFGEKIPMKFHPIIRNREACIKSSSLAIDLAKKYNSRLHILHISTKEEISFFSNKIPLEKKMITSEACIHHLIFDDSFYKNKGALIKWNPAVKTSYDKDAILNGLVNNNIDVIATDHAPHTLEEKMNSYPTCPSGGPMVQHSLVSMLEFFHSGKLSIEWIVEKMCHAPAKCFKIKDRGFIKEGYYADLVFLDFSNEWEVNNKNILYKCGWSPLEGMKFKSSIKSTFVNGNLVYNNGIFNENHKGTSLEFI